VNAINNQGIKEALDRVVACQNAVRENWESVQAIQEAIAANHLEHAHEAWTELDDDTKAALWLAPTKGGIFTTREREAMRSNEWREFSKRAGEAA
jgi:hypothetical protein